MKVKGRLKNCFKLETKETWQLHAIHDSGWNPEPENVFSFDVENVIDKI